MKFIWRNFKYKLLSRCCPDQYFKYLINKTRDNYRDLKKGLKDEERFEIYKVEENEIAMIRYELDEIKSDKALMKANKYDLLIPSIYLDGDNEKISEDWMVTNYGPIILSAQGRAKITKDYREEIRWRRERNMSYFSLMFGLIGSITGLLAVILNN